MKVLNRKNESSQTFSSTGYESFSMTPSTSGQNKRDLLYLFRKLNVNQKYIDIQLASNYKYEDIEKLSEEEFAQRFMADNSTELGELEEIFIKLKSETLPESCEMQRIISVSNSAIEDDQSDNYDSDQDYDQKYSNNNREYVMKNSQNYLQDPEKNHIRQSSYLSALNNIGNFDTQSQYQFATDNNNQYPKDQSLALPHSVVNLSQTQFYNAKQLPYNPYEFATSTYITSSVSISPSVDQQLTLTNSKISTPMVMNVLTKLKKVADVIYKNNPMLIDDSTFKNNLSCSHMYIRITCQGSNLQNNEYLSKIVYQGSLIKIGRLSNSDILLNSEKVSRNHLQIDARDEKYFLKDLGSGAGTYVKLKQDQQYPLIASSIFRCGITEFKINRIILYEDYAQLQIQITKGSRVNTVLEYDTTVKLGKNCLIGSNIQNDISAIDNLMERYHASLNFKKGAIYLTDLGSQTGTWIRLSAQSKESEEYQILDGQCILISPFMIKTFIHSN